MQSSNSRRFRKASKQQQDSDTGVGNEDAALAIIQDSTPTTSDDYSSADEGPRNKKAKQLHTQSAPIASNSTAQLQEEQFHEIQPVLTRSDSDSDLPKPETDFIFDEQLFNNMFASSETLSHDYSPGSPRPIVIDGSNIAFSHGNNKHFSEQGILICVDYFQQCGHDVKVFVSRCQHDQFTRKIANDLEARQILVFTPSRLVNGKRITAYDDRFILQYATVKKAIVVSNDNYRDLYDENEKFHEVIRERLLQFTWPEENVLMFPNDPLGRNGPRLDEFLKFPRNDANEKPRTKSRSRERQAGEESDYEQDQEPDADTSGYESLASTDGDSWTTDDSGANSDLDL